MSERGRRERLANANSVARHGAIVSYAYHSYYESMAMHTYLLHRLIRKRAGGAEQTPTECSQAQ
jgi:hypothetical protein